MDLVSSRPNIVIAGGGYAGVLAANRLAGLLGKQAQVVLVTPGRALTDRIRLHEAAARGRSVEHLLEPLLSARVQHIDARLTAVDTAARQVALENADKVPSRLPYAALVLALGSRFLETLPAASEHAFALTSTARAQALARALLKLPAGSEVAVVGGGLSAIELAAEIAEAHAHVRVSLFSTALVPQLEGPAREALRGALTALGVQVREGCRVSALERDAVRFEDGSRHPVAIGVLAAGFAPTQRASALGLPEADDGRVAVDECLRVVGLADVFAVGDLAAPPAASVGTGLRTTRMGCASAMPMGAHAADQVARLFAGKPPKPYHYQYAIQCISLGRKRGVVAFVDGDDRPTGRVLSGLRGALVKELVCRFVLAAIRLERLFPGLYVWPRRRGPLALVRPSPNQLPG